MITLEFPQTPEENAALGLWVEQRVEGKYRDFQAMAAFEKGFGIIAVVLFHNYRGTDIEIAFAAVPGKRWAYRSIMNPVFAYPFSIGCNRITAYVRKDNSLSRKLVGQLGFRQEGKLRRAYQDGTDALIYGLLPHEYRFQRKVANVSKAG
jgi:RimJ/RimL family protein N-acetyltransferase